jgi:hypothetical protein
MDEVDKVLDALKVHIKKEIVDNYFADRVYVEEDTEILHQEVQDYAKGMASLGRRFMALYQALGSKEACAGIMEVLKLEAWPFYPEYANLSQEQRTPQDTRPMASPLPPLPQPDLRPLRAPAAGERHAPRGLHQDPDAPETAQRRHQQVQPLL